MVIARTLPQETGISPRVPRRRAANRYSVQRRLGFPWLRFLPDIEIQYRDFNAPAARRRARALSIIFLTGVPAYFLLDLLADRQQLTTGSYAFLGIPFISALCTMAVSLQDWTGRRLQLGLQIPFLCFGLSIIATVFINSPDGPYEGVLITLVGVYFSSGLTIYGSAISGFLLTAAYVLGAIVLNVPREHFVYECMFLVVANVVGMIGGYLIENEHRRSFLLQMELRGFALLDSLTGLLNRRAFYRHLQNVWGQARRDKKMVGLIVLDLDRFKRINDTFGHLVGDRSLAFLGNLLSASQNRPLDVTARLGGDEFAAVWYDIEEKAFVELIETLRATVERESQRSGETPPFTVSVGATTARPQPGQSPSHCLRFADANLYAAKEASRNRVVYLPYDPTATEQTPAF